MMLPMQIHQLLGECIRNARLRKGWRQQDAADHFRMYGLPTWRPGAVGQVETGTRKPSIGELLLACAALEVSLADLIPDTDEPVDLGQGATRSAKAVRALLSGDFARFPRDPAEFTFPGESTLDEVIARAGAERDRLRRLVQPIVDRSLRSLTAEVQHRAFIQPTDADRHAASKLGVEPAQVRMAALAVWGLDFDAERDRRAEVGAAEPAADLRSLSARRGHVARTMTAELRTYLDTVYGAGEPA